MTERLRAVVGLNYPKPEYLSLVLKAGGRSKLTKEERDRYYKRVESGEWCDDLPLDNRAHLIEKGAVVVVQDVSEPPEEKING